MNKTYYDTLIRDIGELEERLSKAKELLSYLRKYSCNHQFEYEATGHNCSYYKCKICGLSEER